jgi:CBS domain-containing protein
MLVRDAMTRNVPTIRVDKKLAAARSIMEWARISQIPVVDLDGNLVGMITRDSLRAAIPRADSMLRAEVDRQLAITPVSNAIISDAPTVEGNTKAWEAATLMARHNVTSLPVTENRRMAGMITATDLVAIIEPGAEKRTPPGR